MADSGFRVTYATMTADNEQLHAAYDTAVAAVRSRLGADHGFFVDGEERFGEGWHEERSPIDHDVVIGRFAQGGRQDAVDAVAAARRFFPTWSAIPWQDRLAVLRKAGDVISERGPELAATVGFEVGKNRLEALGDVEEAAEFFRYYCREMEENDGFGRPMQRLDDREITRDELRPFGVWGVISPFNYPAALAIGPAAAALVAGNTVVIKPSNAGALTALSLYRALRDAGVPAGAVQVVTGAGEVVGAELVAHPDVAGLTFTGSYDVGMQIYRSFAGPFPKPVICEMGGKNPVIVTARADVDKATDGVLRSAFGFGGQKCSAASRAYVERPVFDAFLELLTEKAAGIVAGDPLRRDTYLGPVIDERAVARFEEAVAEARANGRVVVGGSRLTEGELARGTYVQPTVVTVPLDSWLWKRELFLPLVAVAPVDSLDQGLELANDTEYGLTAGLYSEDRSEIDRFLDGIEAGVVYVNRRAGATTGAWPAVQPFGGWKGSGTNGKGGGGPYYLTQYLREQSRTVVEG